MNKKPNVLIFYCDDLGYGDLGCYGSDTARTPHIDRLAEEGVRFTDWHSDSPVCSPSRAALLTGLYPARTGVDQILIGKRGTAGLSSQVPTIAGLLQDNGYRTAAFGKWHLGSTPDDVPNAHGFEEFYGFHSGCIDYYSHIFYWAQAKGVNPVHDLWHNGEEVWNDGRYMTEIITDKATSYIRTHGDEPFLMYVAYNAPHYPMHAPQRYLDRFPDLPWDRRIMAAMMAAVDDGVGEIMDALREAGMGEDTIVFFSSDNGPSTEARNWLDGTEDLYYGGSAGRFRGHKGSLFEGGIREPALIRYPAALPQGQVNHELGMMKDLVPTLLELTGIDPGPDVVFDGRRLTTMMKGDAPSPHEEVYWEYNGQLAVRRGNWKLVLGGMLDMNRTQPDRVHLSDLAADPGERHNLAAQYPDLAAELQAQAEAWYARLQADPAAGAADRT
ncbi:sulfatase-like hydrolase/transferase [Paenibacillus sp. IB182496]|uniref:Sulfatase-like hydrolase/transferase n=1 Tax=Paenibacillus sabuli TaxID=2772509 RepID=A0A927BX69_9BACL|nr:sulfatase-like hydrolase/transferase [Paenibacillus sabuli]MBD2847089.1 sulfatase-like hydrolase/transferase [Paenibacillus sabuli]